MVLSDHAPDPEVDDGKAGSSYERKIETRELEQGGSFVKPLLLL
jgi:hypothetical protein